MTDHAACSYCRSTDKPVLKVVSTCPEHGELRRAKACADCTPDPSRDGRRFVHAVLFCEQPVVLFEVEVLGA